MSDVIPKFLKIFGSYDNTVTDCVWAHHIGKHMALSHYVQLELAPLGS